MANGINEQKLAEETHVETGLLVEVQAMHDFNRVVDRKVFVGDYDRMRIELWFEARKKELIEKDWLGDPTFDDYGYRIETYGIEVRSWTYNG